MAKFLTTPAAQVVLWTAALAAALAVGFYLISVVRRTGEDNALPANDMLAKIRDLHAKGELSDEEYRTIKTKLGPRVEEELKDSGPAH